MKLHPSQSQIAKDLHRFRVVNCGRRFGKSTLSAYEMLGFAIASKDGRVPYYAPARDDARDILWKMIQDIAGPLIVDKNEARLELTVQNKHGGQSLIALYGWEAVQERRKGVGVRNDFIVFDEVAKYRNFWEGWHEVLRPTLTDTRGHALFISTPQGFNHFYDLYNLESEDTDYKSFHFTTYDNPHIPVDEIEKAKKELTEDRFGQEYLADFRKTEGLVYKEFRREKYLIEEIDDDEMNIVKTFGGVDFGFVHPAAVITIKKSGGGKYIVSEEWYKTGQTDAQIADYVAALRWNECYPDPESAGGIEELNRRGVNVRDVIKGKDSVRNGINTVRELFKSNRLFIHKSCKNLIWELETYSYGEQTGNSRRNEIPIKENDHACFAAGTIVDGEKIEAIGIQTGVEHVYQYSIAGEELVATPNHPVLTHRGLAKIDALRYNDIIWKNKSLFMEVSGGLGIRRVPIALIGITSAVIRRIVEAKGRDYIDTSGKKLTDLSLKDSISIALMAIHSITKSVILLLLTAKNTIVSILQKKSENGLSKISRKLSILLLNGQRLKMALNLGERWGYRMPTSFWTESQSQDSAIYVRENIQPKEMGGIVSVTPTAVKRRYVGLVPVYNLITRSGMYNANSILVSNCDSLRYALMMESATQQEESAHQTRPSWISRH